MAMLNSQRVSSGELWKAIFWERTRIFLNRTSPKLKDLEVQLAVCSVPFLLLSGANDVGFKIHLTIA